MLFRPEAVLWLRCILCKVGMTELDDA